jgi:hypothetical protein
MESNPESMEVRDESTDVEVRHQLYIDGCRRGLVSKVRKGGAVKIHWQVYGPIDWQSEGVVMMQGLLNLTAIADQLSGAKNGKGKSK